MNYKTIIYKIYNFVQKHPMIISTNMLKRKADDEFKIIVLKQRNASKIIMALHSCNTTV